MDVTQALKDTENALRDFVAEVLQRSLGGDWVNQCGVSESRLARWKDRKETEKKRQVAGVVEERLLYYADFYDIKAILKKCWSGEFSSAFGDWRTMEVWLEEMEKLRDPDAHRRELLPHQKHLLIGIAGEIRTRLIRYRSKRETANDHFPRIESARDSIGCIITYGAPHSEGRPILHPGDVLDFVVTASDPHGADLQYGLTVTGHHHNPVWQDNNCLQLTILESHIRISFGVMLWLRSPRQFHANGEYDDSVTFHYDVLPKR